MKLEECKIRFKSFLFIDKKNDGVAKTLNKGCSIAEGKYITICASDDTLNYDAFEILYDFLENNNFFIETRFNE